MREYDPDYINCEEVELSALENLAIMWDVEVRYVKFDCYTLLIKTQTTGQVVQTFTGKLKRVLRAADAWDDGVVFTFADGEAATEAAPA